jgi:hypothetical protein
LIERQMPHGQTVRMGDSARNWTEGSLGVPSIGVREAYPCV